MLASGFLAAAVLLLPAALAQSTTYMNPAVTTGKPIAGNYTGGLRPQIHYSPPTNFMNDPNGMFYDPTTKVWHLYYQYDATGIVAGNQHWGHATSTDLYHWINQPIALFPINASCYIFSGSAVMDVNNTSGFFPNQKNGVVAVYTIATYEPILLQTQGIAYSHDGGYTFTTYAGNPVLDIGSSQFRDPKVFWYNDHWVMAISYASDATIGFFTSKNLKKWTHASNFTRGGLLGVQYECPNLVEMPLEGNGTIWVLQISINPGAPLGGSISQAFPGTFDGYHFTPLDRAARINDWGKDNYAGQFFDGLDPTQQSVSIGWASNWQYSQVVPTGPLEGWRSSMALPRSNTVRRINQWDYVLTSQPYDMSSIMGEELASKTLGNGSLAVDYSSVYSNALYFEATISNYTMSGTMNMTFLSPISGESLQAGVYFGAGNPSFVNRGLTRGFDDIFFTDKFSVNMVNGVTQVTGVIDRSIFEMFLNEGETSATSTFFPEQPLTIMTFSVANLLPANATVSVKVNALNSAWQQYENENGTVTGNTTMTDGNHKRSHARMLYDASF